MPDDLADYIADNYGACDRGPSCRCLKPSSPWLGRACAHWQPVQAKTWDELRAERPGLI